MAKITGTTIIDTIVPPATTSTFPTHDSQYGKGGWRELNSWEELRLIPRDRMRAGMAVSIIGEGPYILKSMGTNYDEDVWQPVRGEKGDPGARGPAGSIDNFVIISQSDYDNLPQIDLNIIYCIYDTSGEDSDAEIVDQLLIITGSVDNTQIEISGEIENNILNL